jgi:hypothetical protein
MVPVSPHGFATVPIFNWYHFKFDTNLYELKEEKKKILLSDKQYFYTEEKLDNFKTNDYWYRCRLSGSTRYRYLTGITLSLIPTFKK